MHWNHRVVEFEDGYGDKWFSIQEVFYDENDKPTGYCDPFVGSETLEGLKEVVARFGEALTQPTLKAKDFKEDEDETV
jgi:hypothetical protein